MKEYLSSKMFADSEFPVMVTRLLQRSLMVPHSHDFIELVLVAEGHTIHNVETSGGKLLSYGLIQGDCFTILPGEVHAYTESRNLVLYNVAFREELLRAELPELKTLPVWHALFEASDAPMRNRLHLLPHERRNVESYFKKMMIEFSQRRPGYRFRIKLALIEGLCSIDEVRALDWHLYDASPYGGILKTLDYMENVTNELFELNKMARMAGMSVSSYTKKFRDTIGDSPGEYFLGIKLEKVRSELIETDLSISELAFKYGFCDGTYLIKLFRRRHGITPARYRSLVMTRKDRR